MDTSLFDRAVVYATKAHAGVERRGKDFPYIVHPLEAAAITATLTGDQELLAAAVLHDVLEDTDCTADDLRREFGDRVADTVVAESDIEVEGESVSESWHQRKQAAIDRLAAASPDAKMVAMGDKLSNIRAIDRDHDELGDKLWSRFHTTDPAEHEWHYRGLARSLSSLAGTAAYEEFVAHIDHCFGTKASAVDEPLEIETTRTGTGSVLAIHGSLGVDSAPALRQAILGTDDPATLDFTDVKRMSFAALRALLSLKQSQHHISIINASPDVCAFIEATGVTNDIPTSLMPEHVSLDDFHRTGEGYTAQSWFGNDGDSMLKLFEEFVPADEIDREKIASKTTLSMGIPTPFSGLFARVGARTGIFYELVNNKRSISRAIADDPEHIDDYAWRMAEITKGLHTTPCDKQVFGPWDTIVRQRVQDYQYCSDEEKQAIYRWLDTVEDTGTCLQGDYHTGNVIVTADDTLFIDMGDFAYGNPLFDIGCLYFCCVYNDERAMDQYFHNTAENLGRFWKSFAKYYFGAQTDEALKEVDEQVGPFAALTGIHFSNRNPHMLPETRACVRTLLIDKIM